MHADLMIYASSIDHIHCIMHGQIAIRRNSLFCLQTLVSGGNVMRDFRAACPLNCTRLGTQNIFTTKLLPSSAFYWNSTTWPDLFTVKVIPLVLSTVIKWIALNVDPTTSPKKMVSIFVFTVKHKVKYV